MTGIDLTRVRNEAGIDCRQSIAGLRSHDSNCGGCREHAGRDDERDDEDVAFHDKLLWLASETTATGPI
jgi:hypothetical protein